MTAPPLPTASAPPSLLPPPKPATLNLLPLSDLHLGANPVATQLLLSNKGYLSRMDFVVLLGDLVGCYGTDREYRVLDQFLSRLGRPYSAINGNHEFYFEVHGEELGRHGRIWREQSAEGKARQLEKFRSFFGLASLWRAEHHSLGSFLYLGLDGIENHKVETLSGPQLSFLTEQLTLARQEPAYVFCHAPLMLGRRLDMEYYDSERTACIEPRGSLRTLIEQREAPLWWISGHIHLHPEHYLFPAYSIAPNVWQVHCPDSWGYSRWSREHLVPQRHRGLFSRHLEIGPEELSLVTHDHGSRADIGRQTIRFGKMAEFGEGVSQTEQ